MIVNVYNQKGEETGTRALNEKIFKARSRSHLLHEAVRVYLAHQRSGTASTRTRGEVHRTGRKPWRQKGTGRARAGSFRSPIWVGGGNTFGPRPRSFGIKMNKKAKRGALQSALALRAQSGDLLLLDDIALENPKTKEMQCVLEALGIGGRKTLLVLGSKDTNLFLAGRNIRWLDMALAADLNAYQVLRADKLMMTIEALERLDERNSG